MTGALTAEVDRSACNGHGRCYMTAPGVFDSDDDGFPLVIGPAASAQDVADLQRAVINCPERAVTVRA